MLSKSQSEKHDSPDFSSIVERFLDFYLLTLYRESRQYLKIKSLTYALQFIRSARRLAGYYFLAILSSVLFVGGVFVLFTHGIYQLQSTGSLSWDGFHAGGVGLMVVTALNLSWLLRERRWLEAFGLESALARVLDSQNPTQPSSKAHNRGNSHEDSEIDEEALRRAIERMVDEKVRQATQHSTRDFL